MEEATFAELLAVVEDGVSADDDAVAAPNPLNALEQQGKPARVPVSASARPGSA
jgi:hypothetical protein